MTLREEKIKINEIIYSLPTKTIDDKSKKFSWKKLITNFELSDYNFEIDKGYSLSWCNECSSFTCHFGKCRICQSKKFGLGNPEIHKKTIDSQIKNGTFNMLNSEIQVNKVSNKNLLYKHINYFCDVCKIETQHRLWPDGKIRCCKCDFKHNGIQLKFCLNCNSDTFHNSGVCTICYPKAAINKNIHTEFCNVCNQTSLFNGKYCSICNPERSGNFKISFIYNNKCDIHKTEDKQYFDKTTNKYVCWSCFKEEFTSKNISNDFIVQTTLLYPQAFLQTTFRHQDSIDWNGSKGAFEQNLVEKGINWFVYVKFYINKDKNIKPLVVGKSGSLLVNSSGSDVSFSTREDHGPARKFLLEENLDWDKTKIAIISCQSEIDAFIIEYNIALDFNLFES